MDSRFWDRVSNQAGTILGLQSRPSLTVEKLFVSFCLVFLFISWYALILTEAQVFYRELLLLGILGGAGYLGLAITRYQRRSPLSKIDLIATLLVLFFAGFNLVFAHDTFYGGRDPGLYANAAAWLTENHGYRISFPINFPGWVLVEDSYQPQFNLGYISWLGLHFSFGSIVGIKFGNFIPLTIALLSIYFVGKRLGGSRVGLAALAMLATAYPMFWFTRGTYSEIFAMALVWFGILSLLSGFQEKESKYLVIGLLSFGLVLHTRDEGIWLFGMLLIVSSVLYIFPDQRRFLSWRYAMVAGVIILHFVYYGLYVRPFTLKAISWVESAPRLAATSVLAAADSLALRHHLQEFVLEMLSKYNLYWPILFMGLIAIRCLKSLRKRASKEILTIFVLLSPTFVLLINPFIALDQPWFLRRYLISILPCAFLFTALLLSQLFCDSRRRLFGLITALVVITNLATASPILLHREYGGMVHNVHEIALRFSEGDIVLADRATIGHYRVADPLFFLYGIRTFWFAEPGSKYSLEQLKPYLRDGSNIYIVTTSTRDHWLPRQFPARSLELVYEITVDYKELERTVDLYWSLGLPEDYLDNDYHFVRTLMAVPSRVLTKEATLRVYRLETGQGFP